MTVVELEFKHFIPSILGQKVLTIPVVVVRLVIVELAAFAP